MQSIVITPKTVQEFEFLTQLLAKMNIETEVLSAEEREDIAMHTFMLEADRTDLVSEEEVMQKLKKHHDSK